MTPIEYFAKADMFFNRNAFDEAARIYIELREKSIEFKPFCDYRLAAISNNTGDPITAYNLYYSAFSTRPDLASFLYNEKHTSHNYVYEGKREEVEQKTCPLCNTSCVLPKYCYPLTEASGYNSYFNPIRLWMYCESCHHMFARDFPEKLFLHNDNPRTPNPAYFRYYSDILNKISQYTTGALLFEIGIGASECLLVAQEMGFETFGIDVIDKHVQTSINKFGLNAQTVDFMEFQSDKKFDIIIMGDVIEHVSDPVLAMHKANNLLNDTGILWVSTPNFDSAFSIVLGHDDAMKRQQYHLNYFSRHSFFNLLIKCGFAPLEYNVSSHYNGSMEIIAGKSNN